MEPPKSSFKWSCDLFHKSEELCNQFDRCYFEKANGVFGIQERCRSFPNCTGMSESECKSSGACHFHEGSSQCSNNGVDNKQLRKRVYKKHHPTREQSSTPALPNGSICWPRDPTIGHKYIFLESEIPGCVANCAAYDVNDCTKDQFVSRLCKLENGACAPKKHALLGVTPNQPIYNSLVVNKIIRSVK